MDAIPSTIAAIVMKSAEDVKKCLEIKGLARSPGPARLRPGACSGSATAPSAVGVLEYI